MKHEAATTIAIAGGGQAAGAAIVRLRQLAYGGRVVLLTEEGEPPYERPPLSKQFLAGGADGFRSIVGSPQSNEAFFTHARVVALDTSRRVLRTADMEVPYDRLLLATGTRPRALDVPGSGLEGVRSLRTAEDAAAIAGQLARCEAGGKTLLLVGGSWIGLEVACAARARGIPVVVAERGERLCRRTLPASVARRLQALHAAHGVVFRFGTTVVAFGGEGAVREATLSDGTRLPIGAAVTGIGVVPNIELARDAGIRTRSGIVVDELGRTSDPHIHAAGDVAEIPCAWTGASMRYETWAHAQWQGTAVAENMLRSLCRPGLPEARLRQAPWFWSDQYGRTLQVCGIPLLADAPEEAVDDDGGFIESFRAAGRIVGAAAIGHARAFRELRRAIDSHTKEKQA